MHKKKISKKKKTNQNSCSLSKRIHKEKEQQTFRENEKTNKKEKKIPNKRTHFLE